MPRAPLASYFRTALHKKYKNGSKTSTIIGSSPTAIMKLILLMIMILNLITPKVCKLE